MKVSINWLKHYVPINMTIPDLAEALTMAGLEVDAIEDRYAYLDTVVVGEVLSVSPHPNADRLRCCKVDAGGEILSIVCGAPNVAVGMKAPLAKVGTRLPGGVLLEKTRIRGEASCGMLCSETELELGLDRSGLMVLDGSFLPGTPLKEALGLDDVVLEIGLTPNRPDCLSMIGVAREIAAIQNINITKPAVSVLAAAGPLPPSTTITIEAPDHCPRYSARVVGPLTVAPSPFWLQDRLRSVGVRPINNIVDITNFVMLETGQPLHAFDFDFLAGHRIVVKTAAQGEGFVTLDKKQRTLTDQMLMICDGEKPVAIGGVMGGLDSEIKDTTTRVLIESACFNPISIRKTAKTLGLSTDAAYRYERGVDPGGTLFALNRATALMVELGNGAPLGDIMDADFRPAPQPPIHLNVAATNTLLGTDLDSEKMADFLERVEFSVTSRDDQHLVVAIPSFRVDVTLPQDLMEEVARLWGYHHIPTTYPAPPATGPKDSPLMAVRQRIREILVGFGFSEAINYSFISPESGDRIRLNADDPRRSHVTLLNPISEDQAVMRTSLVPGMLETVQRNVSRQQSRIRLFEIGKVFFPQPGALLPVEREMVIAAWTGPVTDPVWHTRERACDFYDIKGVAEGLLKGLGITAATFTACSDDACQYTRTGYTASVFAADGKVIGQVGEVDAGVLHSYQIRQPVFIFEFEGEALAAAMAGTPQMAPIPRFPATDRDITVIVDQDIESNRLIEKLLAFDEPLVEQVSLFDVFSGDPIPDGKKSVSLRVVYRSSERTLEDEAINALHRDLTHRLIAVFDADLPM
ncbi:phenylalanine--tRNA ligase subunit beta [Desulfosarcina sp. OttesenSCG-928-A07]|nr:phenylalanine--tRNA ligase subunit beta [Desulfosarcina sp. OttesenSCG-928-A07]